MLLLQGDHAHLAALLDCGFKRPPKLFLVGGQLKAGLHALELGVESRLRPALHELGVRGLLIALCRGRDREPESEEGGCGRRGGGGGGEGAASWARGAGAGDAGTGAGE